MQELPELGVLPITHRITLMKHTFYYLPE